MTDNFQLIYKGAEDEDTETLQKIKGVFVADLNYSVDDVQRFLSDAPVAIRSGSTQEELYEHFIALQKAGAVVVIESENASSDSNGGSKEELSSAALESEGSLDTGDLESDDVGQNVPSAELVSPAPEDDAPLMFDLEDSSDEDTAADTQKGGNSDSSDDALFDKKLLEQAAQKADEVARASEESSGLDLSFDEEDETPEATTPAPETPAEESSATEDTSDLGFSFDDEESETELETQTKESTSTEDEDTDALLESVSGLQDEGSAGLAFDSDEEEESDEDDSKLSTEDSTTEELQADPALETEDSEEKEEATTDDSSEDEAESDDDDEDDDEVVVSADPEEDDDDEDDDEDDDDDDDEYYYSSGFSTGQKLIGLILVVGILFGVYKIFISPPTEDLNQVAKLREELERSRSVRAVTSESTGASSATAETEEEAAPTPEPKLLTFRATQEGLEVHSVWELVVKGKELVGATIDLATPKPPELTKEEIVQRVDPRPWIYRISVDELSFTLEDEGSFTATGLARAYGSQGDDRKRLVVPVTVSGTINQETEQLNATLEMTTEETGVPEDITYTLFTDDEGNFHFMLRTSVENIQSIDPLAENAEVVAEDSATQPEVSSEQTE